MNPRIITGKYKGMHLEVAEVTRPVTDRVKTVLFDTLSEVIEDATVLDLFAGSGNLGIEALSRGAKHATFVERNSEAVGLIQKNLNKIGVGGENYKIIKDDYVDFLKETEEKYDLIFVDPPFDFILNVRFKRFQKVMHENSILVMKFESDNVLKLDAYFEEVMTKKVGKNTLKFFRRF
jgi:16S rRNA (guanine966-N2)-methyltransferase